MLTPNHLLLARANPSLPVDIIHEPNPTFRQRWRNAQILADHFWRRWTAEVIPSLLKRRKWYADQRHIQVGDLVLVIDQSNPRGSWPTSIVEEIYLGKDGVPRSALVRNKGGTYHRPVSKLCVIEENQIVISDDSENEAVMFRLAQFKSNYNWNVQTDPMDVVDTTRIPPPHGVEQVALGKLMESSAVCRELLVSVCCVFVYR